MKETIDEEQTEILPFVRTDTMKLFDLDYMPESERKLYDHAKAALERDRDAKI